MTQFPQRLGLLRRGSTVARWLTAVAGLCVGLAATPALAQSEKPWDTNTLVNEAHNLADTDLSRVRQQATDGDAHAQVVLGLAYEMGSAGLMANAVEALSWFTRAAGQGIPWAEIWAGDFYYTGSVGVPKAVSITFVRPISPDEVERPLQGRGRRPPRGKRVDHHRRRTLSAHA